MRLYESAVADRLGLQATDLQHLELVARHGPITTAQLADVGGLTTGALAGVIDRLDKAGYVRREPDPADGRKVVVRVVPRAAERVESLYQPMLASTDHLWDRYTDDELALILDFADRGQPLVEEGATWLRAGGSRDHGARQSAPEDANELRAPLGGLSEATLQFPRGVGHLQIRGDRGLGELFHGRFASHAPSARVDRGVVSLRYRASPFGWRARHGELALSAAVRWQIQAHGGAARVVAELTDVDVRSVSVNGGMSHASLALGAPRGAIPVTVTGGVNDLTLTRPTGTALRLRVRGGASNVVFDGRRFSTAGHDARWTSTDGDAPDQYDVDITGGARTLMVTTA